MSAGSKVEGQIYIPVVNWLLGLLTLACVLIFRSNTAIGNGFGEPFPTFSITALCVILRALKACKSWAPVACDAATCLGSSFTTQITLIS